MANYAGNSAEETVRASLVPYVLVCCWFGFYDFLNDSRNAKRESNSLKIHTEPSILVAAATIKTKMRSQASEIQLPD